MSRKEYIEELAAVGSLALKCVTAVGVAILFLYLAFGAKFFPSGLSIGDSMLFIFTFLAFGIQYAVWVGIGYFIFLGVAWPISNKGGKTAKWWDRWAFTLPAALFLLLFVSIAVKQRNVIFPLAPLAGGAMLWIGINEWRTPSEDETAEEAKRRIRGRVACICAGVLAPGLLAGSVMVLMTLSIFRFLGIYADNASLVLDDSNYQLVRAAATQANRVVLSCEEQDGKTWLVHGVTVWWHGIGDRSLIEIPPMRLRSGEQLQGARVELRRNGVSVVRWSPSTSNFETCLSIPTDSAFDTNSDVLNDLGTYRLKEAKDKIDLLKKEGFDIRSIEVIGHTDSLPVEKKGDSNLALSVRRAREVAKSFQNMGTQVKSSGLGAEGVTTKCAGTLDHRALVECLAPDRRVDIKVALSAPASTGSN